MRDSLVITDAHLLDVAFRVTYDDYPNDNLMHWRLRDKIVAYFKQHPTMTYVELAPTCVYRYDEYAVVKIRLRYDPEFGADLSGLFDNLESQNYTIL